MTHAATFGSLFTGIGGIDLGLERAGWRCRWQVEREPYCTRVLERRWPTVMRYGDVAAVDWRAVEPVTLLAGGFPCQPASVAGNQLGPADERWLWPEYARAIDVLRPPLVFIENVPGLRTCGLRDVLTDLARLGFDAEWTIARACDLGAPHVRARLFVVAWDAADADRRGLRVEPGWLVGAYRRFAHESAVDGEVGALADADGAGCGEYGGAESTRAEVRAAQRGGGHVVDAGGARCAQCGEGDARGGEPGQGQRAGAPAGVAGARPGAAHVADAQEHAERPGLREGRAPEVGRRRLGDRGGADHEADACRRCESGGFTQLGGLEGAHGSELDRRGAVRQFDDTAYRRRLLGLNWSTESDMGRVADGVSSGLDRRAAWERGVPRVTTTDARQRVPRLRGLGNAVVPQVAQWFGWQLMTLLHPSGHTVGAARAE